MMTLWSYIKTFDLLDVLRLILDVSLVAFFIYKLIMLIKGTRAVQLIKGLAVLVIAAFLAKALNLATIGWVLSQLQLIILVALPVVFQPELRRALERLGRGKLFSGSITFLGVEDMSRLINEIIRAVQVLAKTKTGALIVMEREIGLNDYIETGIKVDGVLSSELLVNIFSPNTPFHDGASIIRGDRLVAAACFLPLTDIPYLSKQLGTRHRAALGITEISDAVAIVVSEETGTISVADEGRLTRYLDEKNLKEMLENLLLPKNNSNHSFWHWRS